MGIVKIPSMYMVKLLYKYMGMRSPYPIIRKTLTTEQEVERHLALLRGLFPQVQALFEQLKGQNEEMRVAIEYVRSLKPEKGAKGDPGEVLAGPTIAEIVNAVKPHIPVPVKGEPGPSATVDIAKIVKEVQRNVKIPKEINVQEVKLEILDELTKGTKRINVKHIEGLAEGLEQTLGPIRSLAAGFRGGGDIVIAGSGVTINSVNGKKVISATGATILSEIPVGAVNASNTSYTVAHTPLFIIVDGMFRVSGQGYTYAAGTITVDPLEAPAQFIRSYYAA